MAIYFDKNSDNSIYAYEMSNPSETNFKGTWNEKSGKVVEDYITRRLKESHDNKISGVVYDNKTLQLTLTKENGDVLNTSITMVPPNYTVAIDIKHLKINDVPYDNAVEVNYNKDLNFKVGFNLRVFYEILGGVYDISNKVDLMIALEGTTDYFIEQGVTPSSNKNVDEIQYIDVTRLFLKNLSNAKLVITVSIAQGSNGQATTGSDSFEGITVHKIDLSTSSTTVDNKTVVFNIAGLNSVSNMFLEYYAVPLGADLSTIAKQNIPVTSTSSIDLPLPSTGAYQVVARVSNDIGSFYSNWVQANVVSFDSNNKEKMMAMIGAIPATLYNCENANLYKIMYVPGLGGDVEIISYLADEAGVFLDDNWDEYLFNKTTISTTSKDEPKSESYYSYIELAEIGSQLKILAFKLKIDGVEYPVYSLSVSSRGLLVAENFFVINIEQNPNNINNIFNYTEGARENFSLITGQSTTLFNDINSEIEASDGWTIDEDLVAYKISGQDKNLFNTPKDYSTLLNSGQGFTIEVMLKNYNVNGEDPVMNIGNLLFGPGFTRIESEDKSEEGTYVNSRADFEKDVITHLMFVFDPNYKPTTYTNIYDLLFDEGGVKYSDIKHTYPILKVYVNGTINREIQVTTSELKNEDGFKFQIHPKSSDINLYIFRTYSWAFSYNEILKNFISSRSSAIEKKEIYDRNDILAEDGRISFYKAMLKNNVIVFVLPSTDKPLYYGNRKTNGDGIDPSGEVDENGDPLPSKATVLIHYVNPAYAHASGRITGGKYKAQGSSAKKYLIHNTQYSKGKFLSEEQIKNGDTNASSTYTMPGDIEQIGAKKMVGKVNYASSMQSHKIGSIKLYDNAYKEIFKDGLYNGGKKACLEDAFMYFYYNLEDDSKLNTITIDDLYTVSTVNGITVADDSKVKFLGFLTWGSAKADDPTYGYSDKTPEYVLFEGADNASPGANFKQPWAAFQCWTSDKTLEEHGNMPELKVLQDKSVTTVDFTKGLLIEGETIKFETGTDPWDVDYGLELILLEGQSEKQAEDRDLWEFANSVKDNSLSYFVNFYNNCYQYDFTNLVPNPNVEKDKFDVYEEYGCTNKRIYMTRSTNIYESGTDTGVDSEALNVYRWDANAVNKLGKVSGKWVPAGLHFDSAKNTWESYNLKTIYDSLTNTDLYIKYQDDTNVINRSDFGVSITASEQHVNTYIIPAFYSMFKANCAEYIDIEDVAYHQAFIRLVSGTDNRAKNTYFQIIGKLYTDKAIVNDVEVSLVKISDGDYKKKKGYIDSDLFIEVLISEDNVIPTGFTISSSGLKTDKYYWKQTETGDYKIRLMQDDLDTIFATDNNGQLVKPYYLLEPAFNLNTEDLWGDNHSSFFYPFDVCYFGKVNDYLSKLIQHLIGNATSIKTTGSNLYNYFFKVQKDFPEIAYNHHAEIYYEMPLVLFYKLEILKENGNTVFPNTLSGFLNNNVQYPLSLSHGRCLESEYQFMKDRLLLLGTLSNQAHGLYGPEVLLSTQSTGSSPESTTFSANVTYTDYLYPTSTIKGSATNSYTKIVNIGSREETSFNYDNVFEKVLDAPGIPSVVKNLVTPDKSFRVDANIGTQMGAQLSSGDKYKSVEIITGLKFLHSMLNFVSAKSLVVDGITANYTITDNNIVIKDCLPIIENLVLTNVEFTNTVLDFRGCNRLKYLNLSGCTGIVDIIFPENNRLEEVYLPKDLKKLTLGKNPNLSKFVFEEGTRLNEISLDASEFNADFDYIDILTNRIDYQNLKQFVLRNTPESGLRITENVARQLASINLNKNITSLIQGKFIITDRSVTKNEDNIDVYTWGNETKISYTTKKLLVNAFGNIDSNKNDVYFIYGIVFISKASYKLDLTIPLDASNGTLITKPFESLYFSSGNNVAITEDGKLKISYKISGLPSNCEFNGSTGELIVPQNTNSYYNYSIVVTVVENQIERNLPEITGQIFLGYIEPAVGDYAYGDGTFSSVYNSDKELVGLVFHKKVITNGLKWELSILGKKSITDYPGAAYYYHVSGNGNDIQWSNNDYSLSFIYNFMTHSSGLGLTISSPTAETYCGISTSSVPSTRVDYNYNLSTISNGLATTQALAQVGLTRINSYYKKDAHFVNYLENNNYIDRDTNSLINTLTIEDFDNICNQLNLCANKTFGGNSLDYHKAINPLAIKATLFEPDNLTGNGRNYYKKGNWYIPSTVELEHLICRRIKSTCLSTTTETYKYWRSTNYNVGNDIFSGDRSNYFNEFLTSTMLAAEVSGTNCNLVYGEKTNYSGQTYTEYGWFGTYVDNWSYEYLSDCRRDVKYTIAPCCTITVNKSV